MILVTGGTGMAGSFIVHELQRRGHAVRVLARPGSASRAEKLGAEVALGNLEDAGSLRDAARGVAGIAHVACTFQQPEVDVAAMAALLEAWEEGPFVYISSTDVYGLAQRVPVTEDHPLDESYTSYAGGKVQCEGLLQGSAEAQGREDYSILRPAHIWGPHPRCRARFEHQYRPVFEGETVLLPGATQEQWSQYGDAWVDTRDLAWAVAECMSRPLGRAANIVDGHFTWHGFYAELIRLTGSSSQVEHRNLGLIPYNATRYAQTWRYSGQRLEQELGFRPNYRWQDTVAEVVALEG